MRFRFCREKAGSLGPAKMWVIIDHDGPWLYAAPTLLGLAWTVVKYWKAEEMLIG